MDELSGTAGESGGEASDGQQGPGKFQTVNRHRPRLTMISPGLQQNDSAGGQLYLVLPLRPNPWVPRTLSHHATRVYSWISPAFLNLRFVFTGWIVRWRGLGDLAFGLW